METKKTPKVDLENKKGLFLEIGLVVTIVLALFAFNVKTYNFNGIEIQRDNGSEIKDIVIPITAPEKPPEPPAPEKAPVEMVQFNTITNDAQSDNIADIFSVGDNANQAAAVYVPVEVKQEVENDKEDFFIFVEEYPSYPGGEAELFKYLGEHIVYPELAKNTGITGMVIIRFVVEKDGSISNVVILRDIGGGCGAEAMRVVKSMPKWNPGKQRGIPVRTQFNVPVKFSMN